MIKILYVCDICKKTVDKYEHTHSDWDHPIGTDKLEEFFNGKRLEICNDCHNKIKQQIKAITTSLI